MEEVLAKFECQACEIVFYMKEDDKSYATHCPNCNNTRIKEVI